MAKDKKQSDQFQNGMSSKVAQSGFLKSLSALIGGFIPKQTDKKLSKEFEVDFVKVKEPRDPFDILNHSNILRGQASERLEKLFDTWTKDITDISYQDRLKLVQELDFACTTEPFLSRYVNLIADEATQLDTQDNLITIETPDTRLTNRVYQLFRQWGLNQNRIRSAIYSIAKYGDAFWGQRVSASGGVEKVIPLTVKQVKQRLEFNPIDVINKLSEIAGYSDLVNKSDKVQQMLNNITSGGEGSGIADIFETKLFGYVLSDDIVVPPWEITHFRINGEGTELSPYGRTDLVDCLVPFKLSQSTQTLQSIARTMSFPVHMFTVKTAESMDEVSQFEVVEKVRQEYENLGVTPTTGQSEVYTVNTKMWVPEGLLSLDILKPEVDIDFVGDLEMYNDKLLVATGVPKGYIDQEWGGFGNSAVSLMEQYKPFGRKVYTHQATFLEGVEHLIRLHFAITKEFDYKTPFTLSMRFPAEEVSDDKTNTRSSSLDLASAIIDSIKLALGAGEEEELPPAVIKDILGKYTFISPEDIAKWTNDANIYWTSAVGLGKSKGGKEENGDELGGGDFGGGGGGADLGGADLGGEEEVPEEEAGAEEEAASPEDDFDFGEGIARINKQQTLREASRKRLAELKTRYSETKHQIYINTLVENNIQEFVRNRKHVKLMTYQNNSSTPYLEMWSGMNKTKEPLREKGFPKTLKEALEERKRDFESKD